MLLKEDLRDPEVSIPCILLDVTASGVIGCHSSHIQQATGILLFHCLSKLRYQMLYTCMSQWLLQFNTSPCGKLCVLLSARLFSPFASVQFQYLDNYVVQFQLSTKKLWIHPVCYCFLAVDASVVCKTRRCLQVALQTGVRVGMASTDLIMRQGTEAMTGRKHTTVASCFLHSSPH